MTKYDRSRHVPDGEPNRVLLTLMGAAGMLLTLFVLWVGYMIWFR